MTAPTLGPNTPLRRSPDALAEEVGGATVVLDPVADRYCRLNGSGGFLFERLEAGAATPAQLADALAAHAGIERDRALADVLAFARDLAARGLLAVQG